MSTLQEDRNATKADVYWLVGWTAVLLWDNVRPFSLDRLIAALLGQVSFRSALWLTEPMSSVSSIRSSPSLTLIATS